MAESDAPEFPNESAAVKYIVRQVSQIENAHACSTGYYKTLSKVLERLDKTDNILNQLKSTTTDLKAVVDTAGIRTELAKGSDQLNDTLGKNLTGLILKNDAAVRECLGRIEKDNKNVSVAAVTLIHNTQSDIKTLVDGMNETRQKLDRQIREVSGCVVMSVWKAVVLAVILLGSGVAIGMAV